MTNASETAVPEPVVGIDDSVPEGLLGALPTDTDDLVELSLDDCDVAIMGWSFQAGGEEVTDENTGRSWTSGDQLLLHLRVDGIDGIDTTRQYLGLPKTFVGDDGQERRRDVSVNSKLGILLSSFAGFGISGNASMAYAYQFGNYSDLIGLRYHRKFQSFEGARRGSTTDVHIPTEIYGFDNDLRKEAGLKPAELKDAA
jgi:hypothetical protein